MVRPETFGPYYVNWGWTVYSSEGGVYASGGVATGWITHVGQVSAESDKKASHNEGTPWVCVNLSRGPKTKPRYLNLRFGKRLTSFFNPLKTKRRPLYL